MGKKGRKQSGQQRPQRKNLRRNAIDVKAATSTSIMSTTLQPDSKLSRQVHHILLHLSPRPAIFKNKQFIKIIISVVWISRYPLSRHCQHQPYRLLRTAHLQLPNTSPQHSLQALQLELFQVLADGNSEMNSSTSHPQESSAAGILEHTVNFGGFGFGFSCMHSHEKMRKEKKRIVMCVCVFLFLL